MLWLALPAIVVISGCGAARSADAQPTDSARAAAARGGAEAAAAHRSGNRTSSPFTVNASGSAGAGASAPPHITRASTCATPDQATIWEAIPPDEREGLDDAQRSVVAVELDGIEPAEVAVAVNSIHDYGEGESSSHLWILRCSAGAWVSAGNLVWDIDEMWDGFYTGPPGIVVMRAENFTGVPHPFLRVETVDMRGGVDPRYYQRHFMLMHLVDGELSTAFSCETHSESVSGADRDTEFDTRRVVTYRPGTQPIIRVQVSSARAEGRRRRFGSADYQFDGRVFVADRDVCAF